MLAHVLTFVLAVPRKPARSPAETSSHHPGTCRQAAVRPPIYSADIKERMARALELADVDDIRVLINWGANDNELCRKFAETTRLPEVSKTRFESRRVPRRQRGCRQARQEPRSGDGSMASSSKKSRCRC